MITLQEIFDTLSRGELLNLALSDTPTGDLAEEHYPKVISHINLGLIELYKRFNLLQGTLKLHQHEDVGTYYIREEYTGLIDEMGSDKYIEISASEPFQDNIAKIIEMYDETGELLTMNDNSADVVISTLAHDIIYFKEIEIPEVISLVYQAYYPRIVLTELLDPTTTKLYIPDFIVEPLLFYVASRVHKPMGTNASTMDTDKSVSFMQLYELACTKIDMLGLDTQVSHNRDPFMEDGWK